LVLNFKKTAFQQLKFEIKNPLLLKREITNFIIYRRRRKRKKEKEKVDG
jgi:hypothetical protein